MAKRLDATYRPGARTPAWVKVKHRYRSDVQIVGYVPGDRLQLVMATTCNGQLCYVGLLDLGVGSRIRQLLAERARPARDPFQWRKACWIDPLAATVDHGAPTAPGWLRELGLHRIGDLA